MDLYPFNVTFLCKRHESSKCLRLQADWLEDVIVSSSPGKALDGKLKKLYVGVIGDYQRRKSMYMCVEILYDIAGYLSILFASIGVNP